MKQQTLALLGLAALLGGGAITATRAFAAPPSPRLSAQEKEKGEKEKGENEAAEPGAWKRPPAPKASVTPIQAMSAAKAKLGGGTPFASNFEYDEGKWIYGVMLVKGHKLYEVQVDPLTGKALGTETVGPDDEASEMKSELTKIAAAGG